MSRCQRGGSPTVVNLSFLDRSRYFFFQVAPHLSYVVEWTPFQTHSYSENLVVHGIEPGTSATVVRNSLTTRPHPALYNLILPQFQSVGHCFAVIS
jgi:hypothetical protein